MSLLPLLPIATAAAGAVALRAADHVFDGLGFLNQLLPGTAGGPAEESKSSVESQSIMDLSDDALASWQERLRQTLARLSREANEALEDYGLALEGPLELRWEEGAWQVSGHSQARLVEQALHSRPALAELFAEARQLSQQIRQEELRGQFAARGATDAADSFRWQAFESERIDQAGFALVIDDSGARPALRVRSGDAAAA